VEAEELSGASPASTTVEPLGITEPTRRASGAPVRLERVAKRYGTQVAVEEVSLDIAAGEFVSLLGPSGSGKTTTLLMIAGFVVPGSGTIRLGGADITHLPPHRRNIGMVYQSYALFPHMTVARNIAFPLRMRAMRRTEITRRTERALGLVQLAGFGERLPGQLSGGQQQRVALARALVFEPPLLLMDEPLGALDRKLREELQIEIKRIQRATGSTAIYVTHDQEEALSLSDRVVVMNHGRIEQVGAPSELYERPRTRFVADFLGASNFLEASVVALGETARLRTDRGAVLDVARVDQATIGARVTVVLRPERIRIAPAERGSASHPDAGWRAARVRDVAYHGTVERYHLELESGDALVAFRPNLGQSALAPGTPAMVYWAAGDAWVLPARPA
jgi:spermidine/putrescine ABC transporter ATP-binding subunit